MHKNPGWIIMAFLITALVVLASCQAATTTPSTGTTVSGTTTPSTTTTPVTTPSTTTTTTTTTPSANQPTHGGDITFFLYNSGATDYFDPIISAVGGWTAAVTYDKLVSSDWSKGPEGDNEYPFSINYTPAQYRAGVLAESWEIKSLTDMIFHIRQGVDFQAKAPANGREMTANDVVYTFQRGQKDPRFTAYDTYWDWTNPANMPAFTKAEKANGRTDAEISAWVAKLKAMNYPYLASGYMIALDKYTVEYAGLDPSTTMLDMGDWEFVGPTEGATYDMNDWHNACGTGPWIVTDCVGGSSITWKRNPNYWMTDPNHPQNKLPYADTIRGLIILDQSTQLAALRTHKLDLISVNWDKVAGLKQSNPELLFKQYAPTGANVIFMRTDIAPFNDVRVRQALAMGVDRDTIINDYFKGNAIADAWPDEPGNAGYTPIAQMPANVKQLYEYHTDLAKQLLAQAGYPNGLKVQIMAYQAEPDNDVQQLVQEQWANIGVTATINILDGATFVSMLYGETFPSMAWSYWGNASPQAAMGWAHGGVPTSIYAFSKVVDPQAVTAFNAWSAEPDSVKAAKIMSDEYLREDALVWEVPVPTQVPSTAWQPYLKGFNGEIGLGLTAEMGTDEIFKFLWVDQALKKQITGSD